MWNINRKSGRNWTNTYRYAYILQHCTLILPHPGSPQSLISDEGPNKNTEALINWYYRAVNWTVVGKSLVFKGESSKIPRLILFNLSIYVETQKKIRYVFSNESWKIETFRQHWFWDAYFNIPSKRFVNLVTSFDDGNILFKIPIRKWHVCVNITQSLSSVLPC